MTGMDGAEIQRADDERFHRPEYKFETRMKIREDQCDRPHKRGEYRCIPSNSFLGSRPNSNVDRPEMEKK